jgi:hypothetical protein
MRLLNEIIGQPGAAPGCHREQAKLLQRLGQDREGFDAVPGLFPNRAEAWSRMIKSRAFRGRLPRHFIGG